MEIMENTISISSYSMTGDQVETAFALLFFLCSICFGFLSFLMTSFSTKRIHNESGEPVEVPRDMTGIKEIALAMVAMALVSLMIIAII